MRVLGFDTAFEASSVAFYDATGHVPLTEDHRLVGRGHAEILFAQIETVLERVKLSLSDIDRFAVIRGPGSFTGIRVGLAAVRGLALAGAKPAIGFTSFEAMMEAAPAPLATEISLVAFEARRGESYVQLFRGRMAAGPPAIIQEADLPIWVRSVLGEPGPIRLIGSAAARLTERLQVEGWAAVPFELAFPKAAVIAEAATRTPAGSRPEPLYLRPPDAKLPAVS